MYTPLEEHILSYPRRSAAEPAPAPEPQVPTFAEMAQRYFDEDSKARKLAVGTLDDRRRELGPKGPILPVLDALRVDEITKARIREWWLDQVVNYRQPNGKPRSERTRRRLLDVIVVVLDYANRCELITINAVAQFREEELSTAGQTQTDRAASEELEIRPIERPKDIDALLEAAETFGREVHVAVLLGLDAVLRKGEAWALFWGASSGGRTRTTDTCGSRGRAAGARPRGRRSQANLAASSSRADSAVSWSGCIPNGRASATASRLIHPRE